MNNSENNNNNNSNNNSNNNNEKANEDIKELSFSETLQLLNLPTALGEHFGNHQTRTFSKTTIPFYSHTQIKTLGSEATNYWLSEGVDIRIFSNLFPCTVEINNEKWPSTEHYFQAFKYSTGDKNFFLRLTSGDCASYGQRRLVLAQKHIKIIQNLKDEKMEYPKHPENRDYKVKEQGRPQLQMSVEEWDQKKLQVMYRALVAKFTQHPHLKKALMQTGHCWLIEHTRNDIQWADGQNGCGKNFLGKLLMLVRHRMSQLEKSKDLGDDLGGWAGTEKISRAFMDEPMFNFLKY